MLRHIEQQPEQCNSKVIIMGGPDSGIVHPDNSDAPNSQPAISYLGNEPRNQKEPQVEDLEFEDDR